MTEHLSPDEIYERAQHKPDLYRSLGVPVVRLALNAKYIRIVEGTKNISEESALYAANHINMADSFLMALAFTEATDSPMRLMAKREYFDGDGLGNGKLGPALRWAVSRTGQIPVDRESTAGPRSFLTLQDRVTNALERGDSVGLHPEGTRVSGNKLHKFKSGAARIAIEASRPLVPVAVSYHEAENARRSIARVQFGTPIMPEEYRHGAVRALATRQKAEYFTQILEDRVATMLGYDDSRRTSEFARLRKSLVRHEDKNDIIDE